MSNFTTGAAAGRCSGPPSASAVAPATPTAPTVDRNSRRFMTPPLEGPAECILNALRQFLKSACLVLLLLAAAASARAEQLASIPNPRVRDGTWVTDTSGTLSPRIIALLN